MEQITIGQAAGALALIVAIIASVNSLKKSVKGWLDAALKEQFASIETTQKDIIKRLDSVDMENCKNYLVTFLSGISRGEMRDETENQRFWEQYEHYTQSGGNSYIRNKVEELQKKGWL